MIATDVVEVIGELADRFGEADVGEILVRIGVAPDEVNRFVALGMWSSQRVREALDAAQADGRPGQRDDAAAAWLDGFVIGLVTARRDAGRADL